MIRVQKAAVAPAVLTAAATVAERQQREARYDANPADCRAPGNQLLDVPATIYNRQAVKQRLIADQHEKCCYCEAKFQHIGYGDVEHYRPKNGFRQQPDDELEKPGYYWLAYEWDNLLFTCKRCNVGYKRNQFPLTNHRTGRARCHHDSVSQEKPLLLHPGHSNPAVHITFQGPVAIGKTKRGLATIDVCGLNRPKIVESRRTYLAGLESHESMAHKEVSTMSPEELRREIALCGTVFKLVRRIIQAKDAYSTAAHASSEYAGMVRANFPQLPTR